MYGRSARSFDAVIQRKLTLPTISILVMCTIRQIRLIPICNRTRSHVCSSDVVVRSCRRVSRDHAKSGWKWSSVGWVVTAAYTQVSNGGGITMLRLTNVVDRHSLVANFLKGVIEVLIVQLRRPVGGSIFLDLTRATSRFLKGRERTVLVDIYSLILDFSIPSKIAYGHVTVGTAELMDMTGYSSS